MKLNNPQNANGQKLVALNNLEKIDSELLELSSEYDTEAEKPFSAKGANALYKEILKEGDKNAALTSRVVALESVTLDDEVTESSEKAVKSSGIHTAITLAKDELQGEIEGVSSELDAIEETLYTGEQHQYPDNVEFGAEASTVGGIGLTAPLDNGFIGQIGSIILKNVQNEKSDIELYAVISYNGTLHASRPVTGWKQGDDVVFSFDVPIEVLRADMSFYITDVPTNATTSAPTNKLPLVQYNSSITNSWLGIYYDKTASRPWFGPNTHVANNIAFAEQGLIQHDNKQDTQIESNKHLSSVLENRLINLDSGERKDLFSGNFNYNQGPDAIIAVEIRSVLVTNNSGDFVPNNFNAIVFNDVRNDSNQPVYCHVFVQNERRAVSYPVNSWKSGEKVAFYFSTPIQKGAPLKFYLSTSPTDETAAPAGGIVIMHSGDNSRPNFGVLHAGETAFAARYHTTNITFYYNGSVPTLNKEVATLTEKIDTLYPVYRGESIIDSDKPVSCHTMWNEIRAIQNNQNLGLMSYLQRHTFNVQSEDSFLKSAAHVHHNDKVLLTELGKALYGEDSPVSRGAVFYQTTNSTRGLVPFIGCSFNATFTRYEQVDNPNSASSEETIDLSTVVPIFNQVLLHNVQNNSTDEGGTTSEDNPIRLIAKVTKGDESTSYISSEVTKWSTREYFTESTRHYNDGDNLRFDFEEDIEVTPEVTKIELIVTHGSSADNVERIPAADAPLILLDPTPATGVVPYIEIYNKDDIRWSQSAAYNNNQHIENSAINMSFLYSNGIAREVSKLAARVAALEKALTQNS